MIDSVSLVIPVAVEPRNLTLPLALESVRRRASWLSPVLVGEPLVVDQFVEHPSTMVLPFRQQGVRDPVANTTRMLALACQAPDSEVSDPFVWSNDDIYFLKQTTLDDIYTSGAIARRRLESNPKTGRYGKQAHLTARALRALGRPTWDYERHVPIVVNKREMLQAIETGPGASPRSMYQNRALDQPLYVFEDVKAFDKGDLARLSNSRFLSTKDGFPIEPLREFLDRVNAYGES